MQIFTNQGYIPIESAEVGMKVPYYDLNTGELLENEILNIERMDRAAIEARPVPTGTFTATIQADVDGETVETRVFNLTHEPTPEEETTLKRLLDVPSVPLLDENGAICIDPATGETVMVEREKRVYVAADTAPDTFDFYVINGTFKLFRDQSVWHGSGPYNVKHASQLAVGDTIFDDNDQNITIDSIEAVAGTDDDVFWRLTISGDHSFIADGMTLHNANRYWVGGALTSNWTQNSGSPATNWSDSDGGAAGSSLPTSSDDVFMKSSANCVIDASTASCRDIDQTGYSGAFSGGYTLNVYGNYTAGGTYSRTGALQFYKTGTQSLTSNGKIITTVSITIQSGSTLNLLDNFIDPGVVGSMNVSGQLNCGTGLTHSFGILRDNAQTTTRGIDFGTATVNCTAFSFTGTSGISNFKVNQAYTLNVMNGGFVLPGGGTVNWPTADGPDAGIISIARTGAGVTDNYFRGKTFRDVRIYAGTGSSSQGNYTILGAASTFARLLFGVSSGSTSQTNSIQIGSASGPTVTESLTFSGASGAARLIIMSYVAATTATITYNGASAPTASCVDFQDITAAGTYGAWDFSASTSVGRLPGCSNITFPAPITHVANTTWGSTNNLFSTANNWDSNKVPLPQDICTWNGTYTSKTFQQDLVRICSIDMTVNSPSFGSLGGCVLALSATASCYGNTYKLHTNPSISGTSTYTFAGRNVQTITSNGKTWGKNFTINSLGGIVRIADSLSLTASYVLTVTDGEFDATNNGVGNYDVTAQVSSANNTGTIRMGTGIWTTGGVSGWDVTGKSAEKLIGSSTSNIVIIYHSSVNTPFVGGGLTYGNITYQGVGNTYALIISGSPTIGVLTVSNAPKTIKFTKTTTTTLTGTPVLEGSAGNLITLDTNDGTGTFTLSKASGIVTAKFCDIRRSVAQGGATWNAFLSDGNVDGGSNEGWTWTSGGALTKNLDDTITLSEAIARGYGLGRADTATLSDAIAKTLRFTKADSITLSDVLSAIITLILSLADTVTLTDARTKIPRLGKGDTVTLTDANTKAVRITKADTATLADAIIKGSGMSRADAVTLSDAIIKGLRYSTGDAITLADLIALDEGTGGVLMGAILYYYTQLCGGKSE